MVGVRISHATSAHGRFCCKSRRDGSLGSTGILVGIHHSRACLRDIEAFCPHAPCRSFRAACRLGSGRHRLPHQSGSRKRRFHPPGSTCRTQGYVVRCPSLQPVSSASGPLCKRVSPASRSSLRPKRCSVRSIVVCAVRPRPDEWRETPQRQR
jgi:hypothetical protein